MKTSILTICDFAEDNKGKLTIVGTFDHIHSERIPFVLQKGFYIVAKFVDLNAPMGTIKISMRKPSGSTFLPQFQSSYQLDIDSVNLAEASVSLVLHVPTPSFDEVGRYEFIVECEEMVEVLPLEISLIQK